MAADAMRRSLFLALAATVLLSLAGLWQGEPAQLVSAAATRVRDQQVPLGAIDERMQNMNRAGLGALPSGWTHGQLELAQRDLFAPTGAAMPKPVPIQAEFVRAEPVLARLAPDMPYRFLGSMTAPSGELMVYLSNGNQAIAVKGGDRLENGFVVDGIDDDGVHLLYVPAQQRFVVAVPSNQ